MLSIGSSLASRIYLLNTSQVLFSKRSHLGYSEKKAFTHLFGGIFSNQSYASLFSVFMCSMLLFHSMTVVDLAQIQSWFFNISPLKCCWKLEYKCLTQNLCSASGNTCSTAGIRPCKHDTNQYSYKLSMDKSAQILTYLLFVYQSLWSMDKCSEFQDHPLVCSGTISMIPCTPPQPLPLQ